MNEVAKQLGFVSKLDMLWSIQSWFRTPLTKFEDCTCWLVGHHWNLKAIVGNKTHCKRCCSIGIIK